jgi:hypothetical protein
MGQGTGWFRKYVADPFGITGGDSAFGYSGYGDIFNRDGGSGGGPGLPSFYVDPFLAKNQQGLYDESVGLTSGNFSNLGSNMQEAINLSPDISRLATERYVAAQAPAYRTGLQNITNTLEANNQLTGSTTGSTLQNYENDYMSGLTAANAEAAIADVNRALQNRMTLYGLGMQGYQVGGNMALENQSQRNLFNLSNFDNEFGLSLMNQQQNAGKYSTIGGLLGGGLGFAVGGPMGAMVGSGIGSQLGSSYGGGGNNGGFASAAQAYGYFQNPYQITNRGTAPRTEVINNSLATPAYYNQGLNSASLGF